MAQGIVEIDTKILGHLLLLPEGYTSTSAYHDYARDTVCIVVDHKDISECNTPECTQLPRLLISYRKTWIEELSDYKTELADIKIVP